MVDLAGMVANSFPSDRKIYDCVIIIGNSVKKIKEVCLNIPPGVQISVLTSKSRVKDSLSESEIVAE